MADSGMLIGWSRVAAGKDVKAVELWAEMLMFLKKYQAEGLIDTYDTVLLGANGGPLSGFVLVRGDRDHLDRVRNSDDFLLLNVRANKALEGFTVVRAHFGDEAAKIMRLYATA